MIDFDITATTGTTNKNNEVVILHAKTITPRDTVDWDRNCLKSDNSSNDKQHHPLCRIGFPPFDRKEEDDDDNGKWESNCFVNDQIEKYWIPLLEKELKKLE